jgi:hypothetical protein
VTEADLERLEPWQKDDLASVERRLGRKLSADDLRNLEWMPSSFGPLIGIPLRPTLWVKDDLGKELKRKIMADRPRHPGPIEWLTLPGRLLLMFTVVSCGAAFYFYFMATAHDVPAGRYPVLIWLAPIGVGGVVFFVSTAFLLEKLRVPIYRRNSPRP